ncbi:sulfite exporter TauE/SafE family protein [Roseomonas sp. GC11]|uniref:sulfite exporter TauE/SafE family protein n=1 Tax=Roseomonas sp. GC11 TaxID=2950546 RepID=UPI002108B985|nr:sulfite exporter TauE/SafE family protein [Roseomonas sp. GC11]MCQ4160975.1 sulfite exporter TauE/SafE family protein [Roseomonas sp. GC11]
MDLPWQQIVMMLLMGLPCGVVAVTAGGGVTLGVPLLMLAGVSAGESVIGVKVALWAAFLTGSIAHARAPRQGEVSLSWWVWPMCVAGAIGGAKLLAVMDPAWLRDVVLVLLIASIVGTVWATRRPREANRAPNRFQRVAGFMIILGLAVYSGFFGAGYGVFLICALVSLHGHSPSTAAALGTRLSFVMSSASVGVFIWHAVVPWAIVVPLALGCAAGGMIGARAVTLLGDAAVRIAIWCVSILVAGSLLLA